MRRTGFWFRVLLLTALAGCKTTSFEQILTDGRTIRVKDTRFLTTTTAKITAEINPTNGVMTISVQASSRGDAAMAEAVAEGTAKGLAKGLK